MCPTRCLQRDVPWAVETSMAYSIAYVVVLKSYVEVDHHIWAWSVPPCEGAWYCTHRCDTLAYVAVQELCRGFGTPALHCMVRPYRGIFRPPSLSFVALKHFFQAALGAGGTLSKANALAVTSGNLEILPEVTADCLQADHVRCYPGWQFSEIQRTVVVISLKSSLVNLLWACCAALRRECWFIFRGSIATSEFLLANFSRCLELERITFHNKKVPYP